MRRSLQAVSMNIKGQTVNDIRKYVENPLMVIGYRSLPDYFVGPTSGGGVSSIITNWSPEDDQDSLHWVRDEISREDYTRHYLAEFEPELFIALASMARGSEFYPGEKVFIKIPAYNTKLYTILGKADSTCFLVKELGKGHTFSTQHLEKATRDQIIEAFNQIPVWGIVPTKSGGNMKEALQSSLFLTLPECFIEDIFDRTPEELKEFLENGPKGFKPGMSDRAFDWFTKKENDERMERYLRGQRLLFDWDPRNSHLLYKEDKEKLISGEWVEDNTLAYVSTRERYNYIDEYLTQCLDNDEALPQDLVDEYNILVKTIHSKLPIEDDAENKEVS